MLVTSCPRCHESVRIPDRLLSGQVAADVQAQCPWCLAKLDQEEVNAVMPPALLLIGDNGDGEAPLLAETAETNDASGLGGMGVAAVVQDSLNEAEFEPQEVRDDQIEVAFESGQSSDEVVETELAAEEDADENLDEFMIRDEQVETQPVVAPMDIHSAGPRRKKKKSMIMTVGSPILGALLAIPIGGGLLYSLDALPDLGFYPLDGTYSSSAIKSRSAAIPSPYNQPQTTTNPAGESLAEDLADETESAEGQSSEIASTELDTSTSDQIPVSDPAQDALAALGGNDAGSVESEMVPPMGGEPVTDDAPPMIDTVTAAMPGLSLPNLPAAVSRVGSEQPEGVAEPQPDMPTRMTTQDVSANVSEVNSVLDKLETLSSDDPKYLPGIEYAYSMMSLMSAEVAPADRDQIQPLIDRIKSKQSWFVAFARRVPAWLELSPAKRKTNGALVLGKIEPDTETGGYQVRLLNKKAYPVTFAEGVQPEETAVVAMGSLNEVDAPTGFKLDWLQPAQ